MSKNQSDLSLLPDIVIVQDRFVPSLAAIIVEVALEMDSETVGAQLALEAAIAELYVDRN